MQNELNNCFETIRELKSTASGHCPFTQESLQNNDYVRFYTGLPNFSVLKSVFDYVVPPKSTSSSRNQRGQEDIPLVDRIVRVCCALNSICDSVVPFD